MTRAEENDAAIERLWAEGWSLQEIERMLRITRADTDAWRQRRIAAYREEAGRG